MDLQYTSEQVALGENVARFAERSYQFNQRRAIVDSSDGFSREHFSTFAELGWFGAGLSEAEGGFGGSAVENAVLFEGFGRMLLVEPVLGHAVLALQALAALPSGPTRDALVEKAVIGETLLAVAHDELEGWGSLDWVQTRATPSGNSFQLKGAKSRVIGGEAADQLIVSARLSGSVDEPAGIGLFLVDRNADGLSYRPYRLVDSSRVADLTFDATPGELIADGAAATAALERANHQGIAASCAEALGAMDSALWQTRDFLKTRKQFGTTLSSFQALQHRMADMLIETELSRSMLLQALAALSGPEETRDRGLSAAKVAITRSALYVTGQAIQLHGGIGMTEELPVGHYYKRALVIASLFGNIDEHFDRFLNGTEFSPIDV